MQFNFAGCVGRKNECDNVIVCRGLEHKVSGTELVEEFDSRPDNPVVMLGRGQKKV